MFGSSRILFGHAECFWDDEAASKSVCCRVLSSLVGSMACLGPLIFVDHGACCWDNEAASKSVCSRVLSSLVGSMACLGPLIFVDHGACCWDNEAASKVFCFRVLSSLVGSVACLAEKHDGNTQAPIMTTMSNRRKKAARQSPFSWPLLWNGIRIVIRQKHKRRIVQDKEREANHPTTSKLFHNNNCTFHPDSKFLLQYHLLLLFLGLYSSHNNCNIHPDSVFLLQFLFFFFSWWWLLLFLETTNKEHKPPCTHCVFSWYIWLDLDNHQGCLGPHTSW